MGTFLKKIKSVASSFEGVRGAYDLFIYNFGPNKNYASMHIEVPDTMTMDEYDALIRKIEREVYHKTGVILTGIGAYSYNTKDDEISSIRNKVQEVIFSHDFALQMHGFYVDKANKDMRFDVVMTFDINHSEGVEILVKELKKVFPEYNITINPDIDVSG